jgi:hypothetical protein
MTATAIAPTTTTEEGEGDREEIKEVKYRAYHTSPEYNSRLGQYSFVDLYELEALYIPKELEAILKELESSGDINLHELAARLRDKKLSELDDMLSAIDDIDKELAAIIKKWVLLNLSVT